MAANQRLFELIRNLEHILDCQILQSCQADAPIEESKVQVAKEGDKDFNRMDNLNVEESSDENISSADEGIDKIVVTAPMKIHHMNSIDLKKN